MKLTTGEMASIFGTAGHIEVPDELGRGLFVVPMHYELKGDFLDYRAVIVLPYSITNTKSVEQYEMNMPFLAPSPEFALELGLYNDRTATYDPYCSKTVFTDSQHPEPDMNTPYEFSCLEKEIAAKMYTRCVSSKTLETRDSMANRDSSCKRKCLGILYNTRCNQNSVFLVQLSTTGTYTTNRYGGS